MSKKVRRGMHARILWPIFRAGIPEDFSNAESLTLHISRVNTALKTYVPDTHISISGNVVSFIVTAEMLKPLTSGEYRATIAYRKVSATSPTLWEPYIFDQPCFTLVDSSVDLGGATSGMEIETIELNGEIGIAKEGLPGASAYRIAVANGFEGDEAEWLYSLKKPAIDAATAAAIAANAANDAAESADAATSELNTVMQLLAQSESGRVQAEQGRVNAESSRQQAEESRNIKEGDRNQAETGRDQAEYGRVQAEQGRSNAEQAREQSEASRANYETARRQAETNRSTAETARSQAEQARSQAEQARTQVETARTEAESDRETAENARTEAEQSRETAETARSQAEQDRGTTFTQKIEESEQATAAANTAAGAQNTYNVTVAIPLAAGSYYTKTTARSAVPAVSRKLGLVITYATADKIWYTEKYIGSTVSGWTTESNWEQVPDAAKMTQFETDLNYMYPSVGMAKRVLADAGTIKSRSTLNELTNKFLDLLQNTKLLFCPHLAVKLRESGIYKYVTKLYDIGPAIMDGAQTTALNQPYMCGGIAPNEKYALKNNIGTDLWVTHTPISFSATDKWSISTAICVNKYTGNIWYIGKSRYSTDFLFGIVGSNLIFSIYINGVQYNGVKTLNQFFGKTIIITLSAFGNNVLSIYVNGILFETIAVPTNVIIGILGSSYNSANTINGTISYHRIRDIAMTQQQVQDEYNYLRTLFPEIESVQIGTQTWATSNCEMTCTPQGNVISERQAATNVEKITNAADREFSSDTGFWTKTGLTTISNGFCNIKTSSGVFSGIQRFGFLVSGKYYKITYDVIANRAGLLQAVSVSNSITLISTVGTQHSAYLFADGTTFSISRLSGQTTVDIDIDNVSVQEVVWADSTNLYNYVYANTSGTAEQKEYAAVKAAAMWCYTNNDPALGAVYGKLYNWYALKLLQMDIDYYNAANPTTPWGWRVPISTDFNLLYAYLGGNLVAGGKMKKEGTNYWSAPNTGATNESGFSAISGGYRSKNSNFSGFQYLYLFTTLNKVQYFLSKDSESISNGGVIETEGTPIRLIKA